MKIKRGFPRGIMFIRESLRPLVNKIHQLGEEDLGELDAFMDYLLKGPQKLPEPPNGESLKIYDFMEGGLQEKSARTRESESF